MAGTPLNTIDYIAAASFVLALIGETISDQQMWNFQKEKYRLIGGFFFSCCNLQEKKPLSGDYKLGFLTSGLFRYSRHPNFICEQLIWYSFLCVMIAIRWSFYMFSVAASGLWINWSAIGPFLLSLLFQGSTWFTELITVQKYPKYR